MGDYKEVGHCKETGGSVYGLSRPIGIGESPDGGFEGVITARACNAGTGDCELQRPVKIGSTVKTYLCGLPLNKTEKPEGGLEQTLAT